MFGFLPVLSGPMRYPDLKKGIRQKLRSSITIIALTFFLSMSLVQAHSMDKSSAFLPVNVSAPTISQNIPSTFTIPITVDDISGMGIIAFQFNILYNPAVIDPSGANFGCSTVGTLAGNAGLGATCNVQPEGVLRISVSGANGMTGIGTILNLRFITDGVATPGQVSPLQFQDLFFFNNSGIVSTVAHNGQVSLAGTARAQADLDGDGKTDLSIFRPGPGEWWYLRSSDNSNRAFQFGQGSDKIVPADYTGDGKTDVAFFRPSSGEWFVLRSEDSSFYSFPFGNSSDIPVPADYDGDGKADPAVFRPSVATWFINQSSGGFRIAGFGANGDRPAVADFDGDSKADISIFRPSDGSWWSFRSQTFNTVVYTFGVGTDKTVQGDYTGDGKADVAFWRPSTGQWFILRSEDSSFYSFAFGGAGDIPAPGDYDGDGKFDPAVFRPSIATWFILGSTSGTIISQFGSTGDLPLPNAYVQ